MKFNKKKVFVAALAICLISILSLGSLAWFTASDKVTNNFYVATSGDADDPDAIFSVDVWEEESEDGEPNDEGGLDYEAILPGDVLEKAPHVENTGAYDQYIRVLVKISDGAAWIAAMGEDYAFENCFIDFDETKWGCANAYIKGTDEILVVAYYKDILAAGDDVTLFTGVKIPESLTQEQAAAFNGGFSIEIKAHAVQAENVGDYAYDAFINTLGWSAYEDYMG